MKKCTLHMNDRIGSILSMLAIMIFTVCLVNEPRFEIFECLKGAPNPLLFLSVAITLMASHIFNRWHLIYGFIMSFVSLFLYRHNIVLNTRERRMMRRAIKLYGIHYIKFATSMAHMYEEEVYSD